MTSYDRTLTEELEARGFSHREAPNVATTQAHEILCDGEVVFVGNADEVWQWIRTEDDR